MSSKESYAPIEDYGVIGDLHTVALVGKDGSIDFLCFPSFDSPSVFAALLDRRKGGFFQICPEIEDATRKQIYLLNTNILMSRFLHDDGVAELVDFMPLDDTGSAHTLVRQIRVVRGEMQFRMICAPRFDYARAEHDVERDHAGNVVFRSRGRDHTSLRLRHSVDVEVRDGDAIARFGLRAGETAEFVLEAASLADDEAPVTESTHDAVEEQFRATRNFWRRWVGQCRYDGRWRDTVLRSALVLKLLSSARYGSIVAAPTFGLPERIGGPRNWDYRYTWIRDAAFAFYGLTRLGFVEEAEAFMAWITKYCRGESGTAGPLQVLYGVDGRRDVAETTLDHLEGYRGSSPVRIGNAARKQLQLDIYGELMDSIYLYDKHGELISYDLWTNLVPMIDWLCAHWQQPDRSIWEVRNAPEEFLYSRLMCWLAIDRALRLARNRSFPAPRERWLLSRDEIYRDIFESFWNDDVGAFTQSKSSTNLDAAALRMPLVQFIGPTDPRWTSTLDAIQRELVADSLVYRYRDPDGIAGGEGTFSVCTFWYVECLARAGRLDRARLVFEKVLGFANHLGLYSEQLGPRGEHLGNFPQALTHLGLISAACNLDRALNDVGWRD